MPPRTTKWSLESHTLGKHKVLENYMQAWLPIMTRWNGRILFIDAFAGPGEYKRGERGSPVIALDALINHNALSRMKSKIDYLFIESSGDRSKHLEGVLAGLKDKLPPNCKYQVINSTFDVTLTSVLNRVERQRTRLPPSFVMIDPFGVSGMPISTIGRILENPKSEVYISFMYRDINRFRDHLNFERHLDELFGCPEWRDGIDMADSEERKEFFYRLYRDQLKKNGAKFVLNFELYEGEQLVYAIFFATKNVEGCDKMKQAIWKIAPFGDFKFKSGLSNQLTLGAAVVDFSLLERALLQQFSGMEWQRIESVVDFVKSDATPFHSGQLKTKTLTPMEASGKVEVKEGTRRSRRGYPKGTRLRFI